MDEINKIANSFNLKVVEDACHAIQGEYNEKRCGSLGDIGCFSFHPLKTVTTCEGGLATTKNLNLYKKMSILRNHGIVRNGFKNKKYSNKNNLYYEQQMLGYNYRLNEIEAALGISQIKKKKRFISLRRNIAKYYDKKLDRKNLKIPTENLKSLSTYHLYVVLIKKKNRDELIKYLQKKNIQVSIHYFPIPYHPYYKKIGHKKKYLNAEYYFKNALSIPIYPELKLIQQRYIIQTINNFFK